MSKKVVYEIPADTLGTRCSGKTCDAWIYWIKTAKGKNMPVDADGQPHWATCPDRGAFKR